MVDQNDQSKLIELHLEQLSPAESEELRARLASDPELRNESQAIERMLRLLDSFRIDVPADLADRVLAGVDQRLQPIRLDPDVKPGLTGRLLSMRDLVAAAAMIAVAFGLLVPALNRANEDQRRALCESNLKSLGHGTQMYAATFGGQLPFAGHRPGAFWMPVKQPGVPVADNRRHAYLLVREKLANPSCFVCPSRPDAVVMAADRPEAFETFPEPSNTTYSLQCMAGLRPRIGEAPAMPIMADQTPLFAGRVRAAGPLNSPNHGHEGQNVLRMDGTVTWSSGPEAGIGGDNIWLIQGREQGNYQGVEVPASSTDAFLVH